MSGVQPSQVGDGAVGATHIERVEAGDTAKHPTVHRTGPHRESSGPRAHSVQGEKPWPRHTAGTQQILAEQRTK